MDYPKSVPNVGLVNGKFVDENATTGQVGSLIPATWGSAVTDEILNVIMGGGYVPDEAENGQLLQAIKEIIADNIPPEKVRTTLAEYGINDAYTKAVTYSKDEIEAKLKNLSALPVGAMVSFPRGVVPTGFLEANGDTFSAATYPDLAAYLGGNTLPDTRGEFLRGWDHGRGVDAGRAVGGYQLDQMQGHNHRMTYEHGSEGASGVTNADGLDQLSADGSLGVSNNDTAVRGPITDGVNGEPRIGAETRPRNLAVMWCIKAWNAPVNQGNIDIAALAASIAVATPKHYMAGFGMALNAASPTTTIDVAAGHARVTGNPVTLNATMSGVLQSAGGWVAGSGVNKLDAGARAANTWYHLFIIRKLVGGDGDLLLSVSPNAPLVPAGFEVIRRIGSVKTDSSANIIPFINVGRKFYFSTPIKDVITSTPANSTGTTTGTATVALSVPPGVRTKVSAHIGMSSIAAFFYMRPTDSSPVTMVMLGGNLTTWQAGIGANTSDVDNVAFPFECLTDTTSSVILQWQIASSGGTAYYSVVTLGYTELY